MMFVRLIWSILLLFFFLPSYPQINASTLSTRPNKVLPLANCNNWLYLPAHPSFVQIGDLNVPGNQITVEADVNMTQPYGGGPTLGSDIVGKYAGPADVNYLLRAQNTQITTTSGFFQTPNACDLELNKTYHLAMVYDGVFLKYYRNGFLMSQVPATGNLIQNSWITEIGYYQYAFYNTNFLGYINEVKIWNVARTQAQIQTYMNTPLPSPATQTGLLAYYTFDDLLNKQGNILWNGTLSGSAAILQTNTSCNFIADNDCCPPITGDFTGNSICLGQPGLLTFHPTSTPLNPPFILIYTDPAGTNYSQANVQDGVAFPVVNNPTITTIFPLIRITDAGNCATVVTGQSATITIYQPATLTITPDTSICKASSAQLNVSGGQNYTWSPAAYLNNPNISNPIAQPIQPTKFFVTGNDLNNCPVLDSVTVAFRPTTIFNAPADQSVCMGLSVALPGNNSANDVYAWTPTTGLDNPAAPAPIATPDQTTTYHLHISDPVCAQYNADYDVQVLVNPTPSVVATKTNDIDCANLTSQLNASGAASYSWIPGTNLTDPNISNPVARLTSTAHFVVEGTGANGCSASDTITVLVTKTGQNAFNVPNAFTPNNDKINDCFGIRQWGNLILQDFSIYNRWGQKVFETTNASDCWDGTFQGEKQPSGGYVYIIKATTLCGNVSRKGTLLLIR